LGGIPDQVIEAIRERADVVETVGRYVTLRKAGNRFWGLCPFHGEKTASFSVNAEKQIFYCFGCGVHGDVFAFRMRHDGMEFPDVVRALADELGIPITTSGAEQGRTARLQAANACALEYFRSNLRSAQDASGLRYLQERGIPPELIERFQLGYAPPGWDGLCKHLRDRGISVEDAEGAGLICPRQTGDGYYDRFRNRVVFPIADPGGRVAGFGGRSLDGDPPKYMNSPESPLYHKGRVLFGLPMALDAIRKRDRAIVVEGYFDVFALHRAGLSEAVAPCGTALTQEHAARIRRYTREVVLLFDGDLAGQRAAERSLPVLLSEGLRVRAAFLPEDEDPDTLLAHHGETALRSIVDGSERLVDALIDRRLGLARGAAWEASDALESVLPLLEALPDPMERARYIRSIASRLEVLPQVVESSLEQRTSTQRRSEAARPAAVEPLAEPEPQDVEPIYRELIGALAAHPLMVAELPKLNAEFDANDPEWIEDARARALVAALAEATQRYGESSVARLLSASEGALPMELRSIFSAIVSRFTGKTPADSKQVIRDCLSELDIRRLKRRERALLHRLESCSEPSQQDSWLEERQQLLDEKRLRDQRQRTQPWCA